MIHHDELLTPISCQQPYTISQINEAVSARLEAGNTLVWFTAEISNFKRHSSGHCYLRLKDADSQIPAVIWSSAAARLDFAVEDGMEVLGIAALRVYRKGGYYQLDIQRIQPAGLGALYAAFEALKARLDKEGLFSDDHKKPIPLTVKRLGVVTSKTGAALRDIITVVCSRAPGTDIVLVNARVQGELAAAEIAHALEQLNEHDGVDCIIVGRGGGSIEDLWPFNDERVARAVLI
jgi:exodeoxyribonuclease VII large subunit